MTLAARIIAAREHRGITQDVLAKRVGLTQQAIQKLEAGRSQASRRVTEIAIVCGVRPEWLATGVGPMLTEPHPALEVTPIEAVLDQQSHSARLTGDMIRLAYREALQAIVKHGLEPDDFNPAVDAHDAEILARAILHVLDEIGTGGSDHAQPEVGHGATRGSHRQTGGVGGVAGAEETGGEGQPSSRKSRKHAA